MIETSPACQEWAEPIVVLHRFPWCLDGHHGGCFRCRTNHLLHGLTKRLGIRNWATDLHCIANQEEEYTVQLRTRVISCYIRSFWGKVFETDEMTRYKAINEEQPVKEVWGPKSIKYGTKQADASSTVLVHAP